MNDATLQSALDPWALPPGLVVLDYGGVLAADGYNPVLENAAEVIIGLSRRGMRLILASNTARTQPLGVRTDQLRAAGVDWCFDAVVESEAVGSAKPDPRFFDRVLDEVPRLAPRGKPSDVVWVEDDERRGIIPAIQYGLRAVWISSRQDPRLAAVPTVRQITELAQLPDTLGLAALGPPTTVADRARSRSAASAHSTHTRSADQPGPAGPSDQETP